LSLEPLALPVSGCQELNKCRLSETMCDVTILVGTRSFAAHKAVLACAAGYFQNLFLNTGLDAARTYVVDFITPANFEKILSFVYTSELFTDLINVGVIYEVAERLGMEDLLKACHSTFPDLESSAITKQPSLSMSEGRSGPLSSTSSEQSHSEEELAFENDSRDSKAMPCQVCKKVLEPNIQLIRQHARDHVDLLTGNCKVCETHFQDRNSRVTHVLSHIGIFLFSCDMCETKFFTQWQLTLHRREGVFDNNVIVHPSDPLPGKIPMFGGGPGSELACAACGNEDLALQNQPGNSKYSCKVCGKRFAHTSEFNYHRRIHTGEKPYQCKVCHKFFRGRSTIKCHLRTHSGALMYRCTVCGHYSSTLNLMSKHIGVHKGSLPPDFTIEQTFMYIIHSKDAEKNTDS
uniref:Zinc finger and BTB domain containing 39 n=1 Tax=Falco tinnunculus TaxID=100819 RepID=A0A8C4TT03_FALTI